ncbi:cytochrome P450 [Mycobacteroides abscessus]|uniref:cytochrome P450 n=1 Tax=Mycobacteroides abscessus TaxID=36809 RepID=UPI0021020240|nr:cytochrome P450 [Mycobacteroides abscessus]
MTSTLARRTQSVASHLTRQLPSTASPLAIPPAGSGLRPVMGDPGPPLLGHSFPVIYDTMGWSRERYAKYGSVSWFNGFGIQAVMALGAEAIGEVLFNRDRAFANSGGWGYFLNPFFRRGVMLLDFEEHVQHRRILQQAFTRSRLADYLTAMNPVIDQTIDQWRTGRGFLLYPHVKQLTLDVATTVFTGTELGPDSRRIDEAFVDNVHAPIAFIRANIPGGAYAKGLRARRTLEQYFSGLISAKRGGDSPDLLTVLCNAEDDGHALSDEDIINHMIFVMMAAHDTSTATIAMMIYFMAKHPQWQTRARAESIELGKDHLAFDDTERLTVLEMVMKETLRLYPPVFAQWRNAVVDTEIDGHYIPAGTKVLVNSYASHRMQPWWTNPDHFDPNRFHPERREDKNHRAAWVPFGAGAHKCIGMHFGGMEIKAILHRLLLNHTWTVEPGYQVPIRITTGPTPADGLPITITPLHR